MSESTFPRRIFKTGVELKKKVNGYFRLKWIETIKKALDVEQNQRLAESQFKKIMQMGKHTFSVQLLHHLLMLQLKTSRESELWWTFSGKPIRYAVEDFALVTGLNCQPGNQTSLVPAKRKEKRKRVSEHENEGEIWSSLFSEEENPTPKLIARKLENKEYRDPLKVFRLALILLVEGILCPTSDATPVRPEIVEMVGDVEKFMQHPWGRESFRFTVERVKKDLFPYHYAAQSSVAVQGFAHAMVLVTVCCCPAILGQSENEVSPEDTLQSVLGKKFAIDVDAAKTLDKGGHAKVKSLLVEDQWEDSLRFEEEPDLAVDYMLAAIAEDYPFEPHTWTGGVTVKEALQSPPPLKGARDAESSVNADRIDETMIDESLDDVSDPVRGVENLNDPVRGSGADEPVRRRQKTKKNWKETFEKELKELKDQIRNQNEEMRNKIRDEIRDQMRDQNEEMRNKIRDEIRDQMRDQNEEMRNKIRDEIIKDLKDNRSGRYRDNETGEASRLDPLEDAAVTLPPTEEVKELKDQIKEQNDELRKKNDELRKKNDEIMDLKNEIRELKRKGFDGGSGAERSSKRKKLKNPEDKEAPATSLVDDDAQATATKQTKKRKDFDGGSGAEKSRKRKTGDEEAPATSLVDPWEKSTVDDLIQKIEPQLVKYDGYYASNEAFSRKSNLSFLRKNYITEIGGREYQIQGSVGKGGFGEVFKAYIDSNPDQVVALKVQKPPFPWEFHMYRQLDCRIQENQRSSFGLAQRVHVYSDYSILVCDYISHGTLHDVIKSQAEVHIPMNELLCMYYTIEMLYMLETLHSVGIIHGDFKPDNLLIRYPPQKLTETGFDEKTGSWSSQGLCLVDWGRGIDLSLFSSTTAFIGDCRTSGFRCTEMKENKPWKLQVDTYGLCGIVHLMLYNTYMEVIKKPSMDGGQINLPRNSLNRKMDLWTELFTKLLNRETCEDDTKTLRNIRKSMEEYIYSDPKIMKNLNGLLAIQRVKVNELLAKQRVKVRL